MIKIFNLCDGGKAGIKEARCHNCNVNKACLHIANLSPAICLQCIAAFFSDAIPVPLNTQESVEGYDEESTQIVATLHDFILHPGQRPWNRLEDSERLEKVRKADRLLPMLRNYFK